MKNEPFIMKSDNYDANKFYLRSLSENQMNTEHQENLHSPALFFLYMDKPSANWTKYMLADNLLSHSGLC